MIPNIWIELLVIFHVKYFWELAGDLEIFGSKSIIHYNPHVTLKHRFCYSSDQSRIYCGKGLLRKIVFFEVAWLSLLVMPHPWMFGSDYSDTIIKGVTTLLVSILLSWKMPLLCYSSEAAESSKFFNTWEKAILYWEITFSKAECLEKWNICSKISICHNYI